MLVDIRQESSEEQEAAFQEGLIPYVPVHRTTILDDQTSKPSSSLHSVEGGLFGALFGFHQKVWTLLRAAKLDDDKLDKAADHLILLIAKVRENMELTHDLNIQPRLDSMYEEMERLLDEFSQSAKKDGPASS